MNKGKWIWYPNEYVFMLYNKFMMRRKERDVQILPMWRVDPIYSCITFCIDQNFPVNERVRIYSRGELSVRIDNKGFATKCEDGFIDIPQGQHCVEIGVYNSNGLPCILVNGETVFSDCKWTCTCGDTQWVNAQCESFDVPDYSPNEFSLPNVETFPINEIKLQNSVIYDFGKEIFAKIRFEEMRGNGEIKIYYGESYEEALDIEYCETIDSLIVNNCNSNNNDNNNDNNNNNNNNNVNNNVNNNDNNNVNNNDNDNNNNNNNNSNNNNNNNNDNNGDNKIETDTAKAFRFVNVFSNDISYEKIVALNEYLPLTNRGNFRSSDNELNEIYDISLRTLELTAKEFFVDGIKRDRWLWSGDAIQSYLMNYYTFFDTEIIKRTALALGGKEPIKFHVNFIMDYSFYWIIALNDYYLHTSDTEFVKEMYPKTVEILEFCLSRRNESDFMYKKENDWVFVDWAEINNDGEVSFEQLLLLISLKIVANLSEVLYQNSDQKYTKYYKLANELKEKIEEVFWVDDMQCFAHSREDGKLSETTTKYTNIFAVLHNLVSDDKKKCIKDNVLLNDNILKIVTPYMRFYELSAMCELGEYRKVISEIKSYWGGMIKEGASSFWESYDPSDTGNDKYAMYGRPYGKSLCHSWGASPLYLLGRYILGIKPTSPGYKTFEAYPQIGDIEWVEGVVPTNAGEIKIVITQNSIRIYSSHSNGILKIDKKYILKSASREYTEDDLYHYIKIDNCKDYYIEWRA